MELNGRHTNVLNPSSRRTRLSTVRLAAAMLVVVSSAVIGASPAPAQSLVDMYRTARYQSLVQRVFASYGRQAQPMPPARLPFVSDSMQAAYDRIYTPPSTPEPAPRLLIREWDLIPKLGRPWFERNFGNGGWSFLGNDARRTRLDTTFTREIRAHLESKFGSPTQTIADLGNLEDLSIGDHIQFEYWFVLNDSIPLRVMDVNGPLERGVVVASKQKYRDLLPELRELLDARLMEDAERAPYADYYYLPDQRIWFVTGFDGRRYFLKRVSKPNLRLGRPLIDGAQDS